MKGLKMSSDVSGGTPKGNRFTLAMSGRDLMTIGIFLAIYIVLYFAVTMFGFLTPVMMLATLGLSVVIGAIPFMLFLSRVRHAGMVGLFAIVLGIVLLIVGFPPLSIAITIVLSIIIELVLAATGYRSRWAGVISYTIFSVWALSYGKAQGIAEAHMLSQTVLVQLSALAAIPLWTLLADKLGRKKIYIGGYIVVAVLLWFYMTQLHDANVIGVYLLGFVMQGIFYSAVNGVWPAFYGEQFPTKVRLSGTSLGTQIGFTITGFAPTIAAALVIGDATDFTPVYLLTIAVMAAVLLTAAFGTRETAFKSLDQLDEEADEAEVTKYGHSL